ncbi:MAG: alpha-L-rhamnosidase C-terminal domain-containing protein, partial [Halobacteriaceae archaeon]
ATQRDYPSWGDWIERGVTGLCEAWEVEARSHNHHMFGSIDEWFYTHLAGVRPGAPGFDRVVFEPSVPDDLDAVDATVDTPRGPVGAAWDARGDGVRFDLAVPANATGVADLPGAVEALAGDPVDPGASPSTVGADEDGRGGRTTVELPPGEWTVETR